MIRKLLVLAFLGMLSSSALGNGFDKQYQVFEGDVDGDGDVDLYVRERPEIVVLPIDDFTIPIARAPSVVPFVLLKQANQTFALQTNLAGLNLANTTPSSVELLSLDVNLDGHVDALLRGMAAIGGTDAQFVYANDTPGARNVPVSLKEVDAALKSFAREVTGWFQHPAYFEIAALNNGWYQIIEGGEFLAWWDADYLYFWGFTLNGIPLVDDTDDPYNGSVAPESCFWGLFSCRFFGGEWQMLVVAQELTLQIDYSHFNSDALLFTSQIEPAVADDDLVAGSSIAEIVADILGDVVGREVFGGVLDDPQERLEHEVPWPEEWLGDGRLAAIEGLLAQVNTAVNQPPAPQSTFQKLPGVNVVEQRIRALEKGDLNDVNAIVLHRTAGSALDGALSAARSTTNGAHYYIDKNGTIHQTASLDKYTSHVGQIKSKCIEEPSTCSTADRQAAQAVSGIRSLSNFELNKSYPNRYPSNKDSIGIEVVGAYDSAAGTWEAPTAAQQQALNDLVGALQSHYGLGSQDVYKHDEISYKTPGEGDGLGF